MNLFLSEKMRPIVWGTGPPLAQTVCENSAQPLSNPPSSCRPIRTRSVIIILLLPPFFFLLLLLVLVVVISNASSTKPRRGGERERGRGREGGVRPTRRLRPPPNPATAIPLDRWRLRFPSSRGFFCWRDFSR